MGRQNVVVVCLILMAIIGLAAAASSPSASPSKAPTASKTDVVEAPVNDDDIGTTDDGEAPSPGDDDVAVAGPLGSDSSYDSEGPSGSDDSADSGSAALGVSAVVVGVTTMVGSFLFF